MKKTLFTLISIFALLFFFNLAKAEEKEVDYKGQVIIDSDLDGLTNEGEKQIFRTDPDHPDSDEDGIYDGAEVLNGIDPLNPMSPAVTRTVKETTKIEKKETPWAWYTARAGGLIGFLLLYASVLWGLSIRTPILNKIIKPAYSFRTHCWISLQALIFAFLHSISLLFDKYLGFGLKDVFIPWHSSFSPNLLALGIISFYLMVILSFSSYLRKIIPQKLWRILHYLNVILYVFVVIHALYLGTDLKIPVIRSIFLFANGLLTLLIVINMMARIFGKTNSKDSDNKPNNSQNDENLHQSSPSSIA